MSWEREWAALDVRYAGDSRPGGRLAGEAEPARAQIWVKASGEVPADPMINTCVLAYASDLTLLGVSLVPHGVLIVSPQIQAGVARPLDVVPPAVPGRRVAALRPALAVGVGGPRVRASGGSSAGDGTAGRLGRAGRTDPAAWASARERLS